ncbi:MAG: hypothetical protein K1X86_15615 [Ignavibacteria bacterium]|nr:hypothetical protein [Ignavibacteria bacterium]
MARTTKDTPEHKIFKKFVADVTDLRRLQKLSVNSKDPATRNKFKVRADKKGRAVDKKLEKLAA